MNLWSFRPRKLLAPLFLAVLTTTSLAYAVPLVPGGWANLPGTTAALTPSLNGSLVVDQTNFFNCGAGHTGSVRLVVIKSATLGTLDFYYVITNDVTSTRRIFDVQADDFSPAIGLDVDYRSDLPGTRVPSLVRRSAAPGQTIDFEFYNAPIVPGESTRFLFARSGVSGLSNTGSVKIMYEDGATCGTWAFRPTP